MLKAKIEELEGEVKDKNEELQGLPKKTMELTKKKVPMAHVQSIRCSNQIGAKFWEAIDTVHASRGAHFLTPT